MTPEQKQKYDTVFRLNGQIQMMEAVIEKLKKHQRDLEVDLENKGIPIYY